VAVSGVDGIDMGLAIAAVVIAIAVIAVLFVEVLNKFS